MDEKVEKVALADIEAQEKVISALRGEVGDVESNVMSQSTKQALNNALDEAEMFMASAKQEILERKLKQIAKEEHKRERKLADLATQTGSGVQTGRIGHGPSQNAQGCMAGPEPKILPFHALNDSGKISRLREVVKRQQETISWHSRRLEELSQEVARLWGNLRDHSHSGRVVVVPVERYEGGDKVAWGLRDLTPEESTFDFL